VDLAVELPLAELSGSSYLTMQESRVDGGNRPAFIFSMATMGYSSPFAVWIVWTVTESAPALVETSKVLPLSMARSKKLIRSLWVHVIASWTDWIVWRLTST
jgi:hypothetical protein